MNCISETIENYDNILSSRFVEHFSDKTLNFIVRMLHILSCLKVFHCFFQITCISLKDRSNLPLPELSAAAACNYGEKFPGHLVAIFGRPLDREYMVIFKI